WQNQRGAWSTLASEHPAELPEAYRKQRAVITGNSQYPQSIGKSRKKFVFNTMTNCGNSGKSGETRFPYLDMVGVTGSIPVAPTIVWHGVHRSDRCCARVGRDQILEILSNKKPRPPGGGLNEVEGYWYGGV